MRLYRSTLQIFTTTLLLLGTMLWQPAMAADLFDESETQSKSLDERIKELEQSISIEFRSSNSTPAAKAEDSRKQFRNSISGQLDATTLEQEVQTLKSEILELNKELAILEEEILTPVSSQAAFFLSINQGNFFRIDGLKLEVDGKVVEHHLYTKQEVDALKKGAIQRIHTANLAPGNHEIVVVLNGYSIDGREVKRAAKYNFFKPNSRKYIELAIIDNTEKQKVEFEFKEW